MPIPRYRGQSPGLRGVVICSETACQAGGEPTIQMKEGKIKDYECSKTLTLQTATTFSKITVSSTEHRKKEEKAFPLAYPELSPLFRPTPLAKMKFLRYVSLSPFN